MSSDFIKAGLKALAAIAAVVAGGTLAKTRRLQARQGIARKQ